MPDRSLRIMQVNTHDIAGGAEKVAWNLHHKYREKGHSACLAVGFKHSDCHGVVEIPRFPAETDFGERFRKSHSLLQSMRGKVPGIRFIRYLLCSLTGGCPDIDIERGRENFHFSGSHKILSFYPGTPEIAHLHNLHGDYFDLRFLPKLSAEVPVIMTLHDAWLLSGHCAHSFNCYRWKTGCGQCPDLTIYPAIQRDATAFNWRRKREIYAKCRLYVTTPSQWLMNKVQQSILAQSVTEARVIPNGVDTTIFHPYPKNEARQELALPPNAVLLIFTASHVKNNRWKDYTTMKEAITIVANRSREKNIVFMAIGEDAETEQIGNLRLLFLPFQRNPSILSRYYQAADAYLHAALADTFPNSVIEALSCGTPAIASSVGGIPEQIEDGETGLLVPPQNAEAMAEAILRFINEPELQKNMTHATSSIRYDLATQADAYLKWYYEIINAQEHKFK
ncbi:MAG: glycosyltransferase [Nitrospirae bacterium]|nr:glycosyltransferase [Nitrospirota bacterium]